MNMRKQFREHAAEQRRLEFVDVRRRAGGGEKEKARRRRQMNPIFPKIKKPA